MPRPRRIFPDPRKALPDAPLAIGGELTPELLIEAYAQGIFPWYNDDDDPVLWWSPDPRAVLLPGKMHISKRLARRLRRNEFRFTANKAFKQVIEACAAPRPYSSGTWITPDMQRAYNELHEQGHAHSIEAWQAGQLAGGLYGVAANNYFSAESMFTNITDAGKAALAHLVNKIAPNKYTLIDCQIPNPHLASLGAIEMPRDEFLKLISQPPPASPTPAPRETSMHAPDQSS